MRSDASPSWAITASTFDLSSRNNPRPRADQAGASRTVGHWRRSRPPPSRAPRCQPCHRARRDAGPRGRTPRRPHLPDPRRPHRRRLRPPHPSAHRGRRLKRSCDAAFSSYPARSVLDRTSAERAFGASIARFSPAFDGASGCQRIWVAFLLKVRNRRSPDVVEVDALHGLDRARSAVRRPLRTAGCDRSYRGRTIESCRLW
jgi:hypothetical protein